jgi:hypothetical protein
MDRLASISPLSDSLFPDIAVVCDGCDRALPLRDGLGALETLWLHDHDCPAGVVLDDGTLCAPGCDQFRAA